MAITSKIIADSISPLDVRLTTFQINFHRFILPEVNTHRNASKNGASSRAIPLRRKDRRGSLDQVEDDPAFPIAWLSEQAGMQPGAPLGLGDTDDAKRLFMRCWGFVSDAVSQYMEDHPEPSTRLHKSTLNRLIEPYSWQTMVWTCTDIQNFFNQRAGIRTGLAQAEFSALADMMLVDYDNSEPTPIDYGEWHLPYIEDDERTVGLTELKQMSAARCARTSLQNQEGVRDPEGDIKLFNRLVSADPKHSSPLEHQATPATRGEIREHNVPGNFYGWHQFRHQLTPHVWDHNVSLIDE